MELFKWRWHHLLSGVVVIAVLILKKGAARGLRGARPSSASQQTLVADCEETEYHGRGYVRASLIGFIKPGRFRTLRQYQAG